MAGLANRDRRAFISSAAMSIAAARLGAFDVSDTVSGGPAEIEALARGTTWLNSRPLTVADLKGKVVLVDFCTYTCINWLRTLPYLRTWWQTYRNEIVLIGVHTPEFDFEHGVANVRQALDRLDVRYPIVLDNDYAIWRAFENHYWPALYFIDAKGRVRNHQFGEGDFDRWETFVQRLIAEAGGGGVRPSARVVSGQGIEAAADWDNLRSPETYVSGADRDLQRAHGTSPTLDLNQWNLTGDWTLRRDAIRLNAPNGRLAFRFHARDLHLVMGCSPGVERVRFRVTLDRQPPHATHGEDAAKDGEGVVAAPRLYQLIRQHRPISDQLFEIEFLDSGVEAFAFTFG